MTSPTQIVTYSQRTTSGRTFLCSGRTAAHLDSTKQALAKKHPDARLQIIQGCFNTGVAASAGTHDFDAVLDFRITGLDWWEAQRFLREQGWAAWFRHTGEWSPSSRWHLHAISLGYKTRVGIYVGGQVADYYNHALGLKGQHASGADDSWFPRSIAATVFDYDEWMDDMGSPKTWDAEDWAAIKANIPAAVWAFKWKALPGMTAGVLLKNLARKEGVDK